MSPFPDSGRSDLEQGRGRFHLIRDISRCQKILHCKTTFLIRFAGHQPHNDRFHLKGDLFGDHNFSISESASRANKRTFSNAFITSSFARSAL
jgi:hypothetical protein